MFGLFKRSKTADWERSLLINVFKKLGEEYKDYKEQVTAGLLNNIKYGSPVTPNYIGFTYTPGMSKKYEDKKGRFCRLEGMKVFDYLKNDFIDINIFISGGLVTGYSTLENEKVKLDVNNIDISGFRRIFLDNMDYNEISNLLDATEKQMINSSEVYKVILEGKIYYHILNLEDGDFIGIDAHKNIYEIRHDPFEITLLNTNLVQVLS